MVDVIDGPIALRQRLIHMTRQIRGGLEGVLERTSRVKVGPLEAQRELQQDDAELGIAQLTANLAEVAKAQGVPVLIAIDEAHDDPMTAVQVLRGCNGQAPSRSRASFPACLTREMVWRTC